MDQAKATRVISRFDHVVKSVAAQVAGSFPAITTAEDAEQDARILVLSYAGMVPGGRMPTELADVARTAEGDESRIQKLIATQLRMDLSQDYGRQMDRQLPSQSLDALPESKLTPVEMDSGVSERDWLKRFPHLAARILYGMTEEDMAAAEGKSRATIARRLAKEKRQFLVEYVTKAGLTVEGDETVNELQEAYTHLKAVGR